MSLWNPKDYLQFERERTLPCRDLAARIELSPTRIADLGCGPGNSTAVLQERWPNAILLGIDNSTEMLKIAGESQVRSEWLLQDIQSWNPPSSYDLVFSNAALQWVPDHETEIIRLFNLVSNGGALAFQIPTHTDLWYSVLEKVVMSSKWSDRLRDFSSEFFAYPLDFYFDLLSGYSKRVDLWETEYCHVLPSPEAIVEWTKATGVRPALNRLTDQETKKEFIAQYTNEIVRAYPKRRSGNVLFPFLRRFVIAYR